MNRPQVVVFDLGKVLLDFDYGVAAPRIAARGNVSPEAVKRLVNQSPLLFRYETGLITTDEFFAEVKSATAFGGDFNQFKELFGDIFTPITPMIELHSELRKKSIPIYIFSNTNELQIGYIRRKFPFMKDFDGYILSFEHRAMKPDAKKVCEILNWNSPSMTVFDTSPPLGAPPGSQSLQASALF